MEAERKMKRSKLIVVLLALIMALTLIACNKKADDSDEKDTKDEADVEETDATESETAEETEEAESEITEETEEPEEIEETESESAEETDVIDSEDPDETEEADTDQVTTGEIYETEEFSVSVPEGWVTPSMEGEVHPYKVDIFKGDAEDPLSLLKAPVLNLEYGDSDNPLTKMDKKFYEDSEDIDPIEIGGKSFSGFTAKSSGVPMTCLYAEDGDMQYQIYVWTEKEGGNISLEDADVIEIIESFQGK